MQPDFPSFVATRLLCSPYVTRCAVSEEGRDGWLSEQDMVKWVRK